ncbi:hypothetical protein [Pontibacillus salipaludis]|uniref:hypothetical protein n=1 Tax=Pontibacillus salipaludis TaxID=1697394 RepID=UPI0031EE1D8A
MNEEYIPAIITASVAFLAAVIAQFISYFLSEKRSRRNEYFDKYERFVAPYVNEVLIFYKTETNYDHLSDVITDLDINNLVMNINENKKYSNTRLLECFFEIEENKYFSDYRGDTENRLLVKMLFWYLDYSNNIMKKLPQGKGINMTLQIREHQKLFGIWYMLMELDVPYSKAIDFMRLDFYFKSFLSDRVNLKALRKMMLISPDKKTKDYIGFFLWMISNVEVEMNKNSMEQYERTVFFELEQRFLNSLERINYLENKKR